MGIDRNLKFPGEKVIIIIHKRKRFDQQIGMVGIQNGAQSGIEVITVEICRKLSFFLRDDFEIPFYEIKTLHHTIALVKTSFREQQHHETIEKSLVHDQLKTALFELGTEIEDRVLVHLPKES